MICTERYFKKLLNRKPCFTFNYYSESAAWIIKKCFPPPFFWLFSCTKRHEMETTLLFDANSSSLLKQKRFPCIIVLVRKEVPRSDRTRHWNWHIFLKPPTEMFLIHWAVLCTCCVFVASAAKKPTQNASKCHRKFFFVLFLPWVMLMLDSLGSALKKSNGVTQTFLDDAHVKMSRTMTVERPTDQSSAVKLLQRVCEGWTSLKLLYSLTIIRLTSE